MINCMIAGVGGQGTVLASKLIAQAAMEQGLSVRTTETIGMAQRGGSVVSHIRMGEQIHSPLTPLQSADIILAFEPAEAVRIMPFFAKDGVMVVCDKAVKPIGDSTYAAASMIEYLKSNVSKLIVVNGEDMLRRCGNSKTLNVALLGTAMESGVFPFTEADIRNTIANKIPERFQAINLTAFTIGREAYYEQ